ncbi:hypothetical protein AKO1_013286 [Acrasis kona]|uniref:Uncharacterized protein n=1 Tax=Acrasis kona TaxID=1008807 RepID=A0AAW2YZJ3_9EUKA
MRSLQSILFFIVASVFALDMARLVLHFDINKTLIMSDSAGGKGMEDLVNQIIMQNIWGYVNMEKLNKTNKTDRINLYNCWVCVSTEPTIEPPLHNETLYNLDDFVSNFVYPYPEWSIEDPNGEISPSERLEINKVARDGRTIIRKDFLNTAQGAPWKTEVDSLLNKLKAPESVGGGFVNILPGFFDLLLHLTNKNRDFTIIFRTFGDMHDISLVTKEFNLFCSGLHPRYTNVPSSLELKQLLVDPNIPNKNVGFMFLHGPSAEQVHLFTGSIERPLLLKDLMNQQEISNLEEVVNSNSVVPLEMYTGYKSIYNTVSQHAKDGRTCSYRDFYYWWNVNNERSHAGKVYVVDPSDTKTLQIFLYVIFISKDPNDLFSDDNVYMGHESPSRGIINMRDSRTGENMRHEQFVDMLLVHVEPFDAIRDPLFFIKKVELCEKKWLEYSLVNGH